MIWQLSWLITDAVFFSFTFQQILRVGQRLLFSLHVYLQIMGMILVRATLQAMVLIGKELCLMFLIGNGSFFFLLSQGVSPIEHRA